MIDSRFWNIEQSAGFVLILSFVVFFVGAAMYWIRWIWSGSRDAPPPSHIYFVWERSIIMAAVVLTAIGFVLLEAVLQDTDGLVLARTGATAYLMSGVLWLVAEAFSLNQDSEKNSPLTAIKWGRELYFVYFVLAFLAQVAIGGALLQVGLLAAWIGWATIVWNMGWLAAALITRGRSWIPAHNHLMPLVIGIALLSQTA